MGVGVVDVDGVAGVVDVQQLAVGAGHQRHARTPRELDPALDPPPLQIEGPELVEADLRAEPVPFASARRQREAHALARPEGVEVDILLREVHARDAHHLTALHRVRHPEEVREDALVVVGAALEAHVHAAEPLLQRLRQLPAVDLGEVPGLHGDDVAAEEVEEVAVRREHEVGALALLAHRTRHGVGHFVRIEVDAKDRELADLEAVEQLGVAPRTEQDVLAARLHHHRTDAHPGVALAQGEGVDGAPLGEIDHLDVLHGGVAHIEHPVVRGELHQVGDARGDGDALGDLEGRLVDDVDGLVVGPHVDGAVAARAHLLGGQGRGEEGNQHRQV